MPWTLLALIPALFGVGLQVLAVSALGWRRALDLTDRPPHPELPRLVFGGPFRWVRHPQSLGLASIVFAAALAGQRPALWGLALVVTAVIVWLALRDDREQGERFGEPYDRYRRSVPLLLPRWR